VYRTVERLLIWRGGDPTTRGADAVDILPGRTVTRRVTVVFTLTVRLSRMVPIRRR